MRIKQQDCPSYRDGPCRRLYPSGAASTISALVPTCVSRVKQPSTSGGHAVPLTMNHIVSPEVVDAIADTLRESAAQPPSASQASALSPADSPPANAPASGVLLFIANLLSNTGLARAFGDARPEAALLRGSLVGLASGVEAVTGINVESAKMKWRPLTAILTV